MQLDELMDPERGFLGREGLILRVDILECCPWFEFADLETYASGTHSAAFRTGSYLLSKSGPVILIYLCICTEFMSSAVPWIPEQCQQGAVSNSIQCLRHLQRYQRWVTSPAAAVRRGCSEHEYAE